METLAIIVGVIFAVLVLIGSISKGSHKKQNKATTSTKSTPGKSNKAQGEIRIPAPSSPEPEWPDIQARIDDKVSRKALIKDLEKLAKWADKYRDKLQMTDYDSGSPKGKAIEQEENRLLDLIDKAHNKISDIEEMSDIYMLIPNEVMALSQEQANLCWQPLKPSERGQVAHKLNRDLARLRGFSDGKTRNSDDEPAPETPTWLPHVAAARDILTSSGQAEERRAKLIALAGDEDASELIDHYLQYSLPGINSLVRESLQDYGIFGAHDLTENTDWDAILNLHGIGKKTVETLKGYVSTPEPA